MNQQDATAWVWNQIWDAGNARRLVWPLEVTTDWCEFDVTAPDGTQLSVQVVVH